MEETEKESAIKKIVASVKSPARDAHSRVGSGFSLSEIKAAGKTIMLLKELNIKIDYFRNSAHNWNIQQLKTLRPPEKKKSEKEPYLTKEERIKARRKRAKKRVKPAVEVERIPEIEEDIFYEADEIEAIPEKKAAKSKPAPKPKPAAKAKPKPAIKAKTPEPPKAKPTPAIKAKTPEPPKTKIKPAAKAKPTPTIKAKTPEPPKTKVKPAPKAKPKKAPVVKEEPTGIPLNKLSGLGAATAKKFAELGVKSVQDLLEEDADELAMLISGVSADRIKKWMQEGKDLLEK